MEVTILIPTYNRAEKLERALRSVAGQTYPYWRVSIYDDGSTDETAKVMNSFGFDNTRLCFGKENKGEGVARNWLLDTVETPYFAWLDDDDECTPDRLERQLTTIGEADACFSGADDLRPLMGSGLFKRTCSLARFSTERLKRHDWYWMRKLIAGGMKYVFINEPLYKWNKQ